VTNLQANLTNNIVNWQNVVIPTKKTNKQPCPPPQNPARIRAQTAHRGAPTSNCRPATRKPDPARRPHSRVAYRQLKLAAVLRGVTVQTLVEHAIQEFLTKQTVLPALLSLRGNPVCRVNGPVP
jgi:hypothetical protein